MSTDIQLLVAGAAITAFSGLLGFLAKMLGDYYFLKSPTIKAQITIIPKSAMPPDNGYRTYEYKITVTFLNYSKHDAYGMKIKDFKLRHPFKIKDGFSIPKVPLTDITPLEASITVNTIMEITPEHIYSDAAARLIDIDKRANIDFEYYNVHGKSYTKKLHGEMKPGKPGFELWFG